MSDSKNQYKDLKVEGFERVVECRNEAAKLHAIIAIHDTRLGPALGGIRAYPYASFDEALTDVTRLAEGMSHKSAISEVGTGGGKSIIILEEGQEKTRELLHAFAEAVNSFGGHYICAEDYNMTQEDLDVIGEKTRYIVGFAKTSGNPSRFTAWGGMRGIHAVAQFLWGSDSLKGKKIALQGLGAAGMRLAQFLFWEGAELLVADIDDEKVKIAVRDLAATAVSVDEIASVECDIFAPCALGGGLNENTIPLLNCKAVAGLCNNQLLTKEDGVRLHERGILYAPDFIFNAGGLMNVCQEIREAGYSAVAAREKIDQLYPILLKVFKLAEEKQLPTSQIGYEIAEHNLDTGIGKRKVEPVFHQ